MITAYRHVDRSAGRRDLAALAELHRLGRTLNTRQSDILALFDRPETGGFRPLLHP